ncbi:MAG: hypothetical protein IPJ94_26645 [Chloroflexi bacterium]|nr:hypothetical protein [Chloroflexota bacterium]
MGEGLFQKFTRQAGFTDAAQSGDEDGLVMVNGRFQPRHLTFPTAEINHWAA